MRPSTRDEVIFAGVLRKFEDGVSETNVPFPQDEIDALTACFLAGHRQSRWAIVKLESLRPYWSPTTEKYAGVLTLFLTYPYLSYLALEMYQPPRDIERLNQTARNLRRSISDLLGLRDEWEQLDQYFASWDDQFWWEWSDAAGPFELDGTPICYEFISHMDAVLLFLRTFSGEEVEGPLLTEVGDAPLGEVPQFIPNPDASQLAKDLVGDLPALLHQRVEGLRIMRDQLSWFGDRAKAFEDAIFQYAVSAGIGDDVARG